MSTAGDTGEGPPLPTLKRPPRGQKFAVGVAYRRGPPSPYIEASSAPVSEASLAYTGEGPPLPTLKLAHAATLAAVG